MKRFVFIAGLLLAGCQVVGPVQRANQPPQRIDDPRLTIEEQQRRGRAGLAMPDNSPTSGPRID
jgi:hypothetical protein